MDNVEQHKHRDDCVFCNFADRDVVIHEDNSCFSVISTQPINNYHVLVIPKEHYEDFIELPDSLAAHIFATAKRLSMAVRDACEPDAVEHISDDDVTKTGFNLLRHYKFHNRGDKVKIDWGRDPEPGLQVRAELAKKVKAHLI